MISCHAVIFIPFLRELLPHPITQLNQWKFPKPQVLGEFDFIFPDTCPQNHKEASERSLSLLYYRQPPKLVKQTGRVRQKPGRDMLNFLCYYSDTFLMPEAFYCFLFSGNNKILFLI